MTSRLAHRPWHRIIDRRAITFHDVVNAERRAGLEYPRDLAVQPLAIVNVHRDMHGDSAVELGGAIAHIKGAPDFKGRQFRLAGAPTEFGRDLDEFWGKVDAGNMRAEAVCEIARRPAKPT